MFSRNFSEQLKRTKQSKFAMVMVFSLYLLFLILLITNPANALTTTDAIPSNLKANYADKTILSDRISMYRIYNKNTGEHFYTSSTKEKIELISAGWIDEGTGWIAPNVSNSPVYRLYNPYVLGGDHHYTTDKNEYEKLGSLGWVQEGIGWYSVDVGDFDRVAVYRQYNPYAKTGTHNFTSSKNENDYLCSLHWETEGIMCYAYSIDKIDISVEGRTSVELGPVLIDDNNQHVQTVKSLRVNNHSLKSNDYIVIGNKASNAGNHILKIIGTGEKFTGTIQLRYNIKELMPLVSDVSDDDETMRNTEGLSLLLNSFPLSYDLDLAEDAHIVTFDSNGGSSVASQFIEDGFLAEVPSKPYRIGYRFNGWYTDDVTFNNRYNFSTPVLKSMTLYASWIKDSNASKYTVTFDTNGGVPSIAPIEVSAGQHVTRPHTDPSIDGKKFAGWYLLNNGKLDSEQFDFTSYIVSFDITLQAKYIDDTSVLEKPKITFNANKGTWTDGTNFKVIETDDNYLPKLPDEEPTRDGFKFAGWYEESDVNPPYSKVFEKNDEVNMNKTVYARWVLEDVTLWEVKFNTYPGSSITTQYVADGEMACIPSDPKMLGFTFLGWYADEDHNMPYNFYSQVKSNITIYAKWKQGTYETVKLSFVTNGGTQITPQIVQKGEKPNSNVVTTRNKYTFKGWFADKTLDSLFDFNCPLQCDTTIYAGWYRGESLTTWNVSFDTRGGTTVPNQNVLNKKCCTRPADPLKSGGYTFAGWYTNENYDSCFDFSTPITQTYPQTGTTKILYAKWDEGNIADETETLHKVIFKSNGGKFENGEETYEIQNVKNNARLNNSDLPNVILSGYTFTGWWLDDNNAYSCDLQITNDITVKAHWTKKTNASEEVKTHTVIFDSKGGSAVGTQTIASGSYAKEPNVPVKVGYIFEGWFSDTNYTNKYNFRTKVNENIVLFAKWTEDPNASICTVTFSNEGGSSVASQSVKYGQTATCPYPTPSNGSLVFNGWYYDKQLSRPYDFSTPVLCDIVLYAKFLNPSDTQVTHTVRFNACGGTPSLQKYYVLNNTTITEQNTPEEPTRDGFIFGGWFEDRDCVAPTSVMFDLVNTHITNDMTLFARWIAGEDAVTFDVSFVTNRYVDSKGNVETLNQASKVSSQKIEKGGMVFVPRSPNCPSYTFGGWYLDENYTESYNFYNKLGVDFEIQDSLVIYAKWYKNNEDGQGPVLHKVSFDTNGGKPEIYYQLVRDGDTATKPKTEPNKEGFTFMGWYEDKDAVLPTSKYFDFENTPIKSDITLYARWVKGVVDKFTVTFHYYSENSTSETIEYKYSEGTNEKLAYQTVEAGGMASIPDEPTEYGFKFGGWFKDKGKYDEGGSDNGFTEPYNFYNPVNEDTNLYARWYVGVDVQTHKVMFETNGGTKISPQTVAHDKLAINPGKEATKKAGYTFVGWYEDKDFKRRFDWKSGITKDTTIYARWVEGEYTTYTVQFDTGNEGSATTVAEQVVIERGCAERPKLDPARSDGYIFAGWYIDKECSENGSFDFNNQITSSYPNSGDTKTLYAKWEKRNTKDENKTAHKVVFRLNGGTWFGSTNEKQIDVNNGSSVETYFSNEGTSADKQYPTKEGCTFAGWWFNDNNAYSYDLAITNDITVVAHWEQRENKDIKTVKFHTNGGSSLGLQSVASGNKAIRPDDPEKYGYFFEDWYTDNNTFTNKFNFDRPITSDIDLYAKWTADENAKSCSVKFMNGNDEYTNYAQTVKFGNKATCPYPNPTDPSKTFYGWYCDKDLEILYDFSWIVTGDTILYAKFANEHSGSDKVKVTFNALGGHNSEGKNIWEIEVEIGDKAIKPDPDPVYDGYKFGGWFEAEYIQAPDSKPFEFETRTITNEITLYARWISSSDVRYTVEFVTNETKNELGEIVYLDNADIIDSQTIEKDHLAFEPYSPTCPGYTFSGWYTDENLEEQFNFYTEITEDTKVYARWSKGTKTTHEITFDTNGGKPKISKQYVADGDMAVQPKDPSKEDYKFAGWFNNELFDAVESQMFDFAHTPVASGITLYAHWVEDNSEFVTVTFDTRCDDVKVSPQNIAMNGNAFTPNEPVRNGYKFGGWYDELGDENTEAIDNKGWGCQYNFYTSLSKNKTLYARWVKDSDNKFNSVQYFFDLDGADQKISPQIIIYYFEEVSGKTVYAHYDYAVDPLTNKDFELTREGYVFGGWFLDRAFYTPFNFNSIRYLNQGSANKVYLYLRWWKVESTNKTYTVKFDVGDRKLYQDYAVEQIVLSGKCAYSPKNFIVTGNEFNASDFAGWFNGEEQFDFSTPITSDLTLTAKWKSYGETTQHKVKFNLNGGAINGSTLIETKTVNNNDFVGDPGIPTKSGYIFTGWYVDDGYGNLRFNLNSYGVTNNLTLKAHWVQNET